MNEKYTQSLYHFNALNSRCITHKICEIIWFIDTKIKYGGNKLDYINAFLVGGGFCVLGQILIDKTKLTPARILTGFVVVGVLLSATGLYEPIAEIGGAGASVPLCGFGHLMAQGVKDAVLKDGAIGVLSGALTSASAGITAAVVFSLIASLLSSSKEK